MAAIGSLAFLLPAPALPLALGKGQGILRPAGRIFGRNHLQLKVSVVSLVFQWRLVRFTAPAFLPAICWRRTSWKPAIYMDLADLARIPCGDTNYFIFGYFRGSHGFGPATTNHCCRHSNHKKVRLILPSYTLFRRPGLLIVVSASYIEERRLSFFLAR